MRGSRQPCAGTASTGPGGKAFSPGSAACRSIGAATWRSSSAMDDRSHQADNLSPDEKRKLLRQLLLARADRPKQFPLSYAQQRLWVLAQFAPDSVAYTLPL